jgi:uncharacterized protein YbjT (DUF2867 family)
MKTAVIAGSTGLIGEALLGLLLKSDQYDQVVALTRRPLARSEPKLVQVITDLAGLDEQIRAIRPTHVFCCLGTTMAKAGSKEKFYEVDFVYPYHLGQITHKLGAEKFLLVSALGADKNSSIYYNRVKGEVENALQTLDFQSLHVFRPSLLLGNRKEKRPGEDAAKRLYKFFGFIIPIKYKAIEAEKVAKAMMAAAAHPAKGFFIHPSGEMQQY